MPLASTRQQALQLLLIPSPHDKASAVRHAFAQPLPLSDEECALVMAEPGGIPGRTERPVLVHPSQLKTRAVGTLAGRAGLIHALAHIEANAIDLALDVVWRFCAMPPVFYQDWLKVACEEALHFELLCSHLHTLSYAYGDFPAHSGLWDMVEKTKGDVLARLALVPRTLEARGLDASPAVKNRLISVGDRASADILDIILRDEIGHVAIGNRWYRHLCLARALDPVLTYAEQAQRYGAPVLKGPFNWAARRAAGFDETELALLGA